MAVTPTQKNRIKEEAGFQCGVPTCNNTSPLEIHHIIHQEDGGLDVDDNLICLCGNCHGRYHLREIPKGSIVKFKQRLIRISAGLAPHEYKFLEQLNQGENIELDGSDISLARRIERHKYITITKIHRDLFRLSLTPRGEAFIT
jgi:hypothetical protein